MFVVASSLIGTPVSCVCVFFSVNCHSSSTVQKLSSFTKTNPPHLQASPIPFLSGARPATSSPSSTAPPSLHNTNNNPNANLAYYQMLLQAQIDGGVLNGMSPTRMSATGSPSHATSSPGRAILSRPYLSQGTSSPGGSSPSNAANLSSVLLGMSPLRGSPAGVGGAASDFGAVNALAQQLGSLSPHGMVPASTLSPNRTGPSANLARSVLCCYACCDPLDDRLLNCVYFLRLDASVLFSIEIGVLFAQDHGFTPIPASPPCR